MQFVCRAVQHRWSRSLSHSSGELVSSRFNQLGIHVETLRALSEVFRYSSLTATQKHVLPALLSDTRKNAVIHAHTGTGKTLAYLIPAVEQLARLRPRGVGVLILSPTRDLALQITREAEKLCSFHGIEVVPLIGGMHRRRDETTLRRRRPGIIVATPHRILEHFVSTPQFHTLFDELDTLVLDECDHLLSEEEATIRDLASYLPPFAQRRSILCSATVPARVRDLASNAGESGYQLFDCVGEGTEMQSQLQQEYIACPGLLLFTVLNNLLLREVVKNPLNHKVMVFFPTARFAAFAGELFRRQLKMPVHELHARCLPEARISMQKRFVECSSGVLFTAGSSERGMDYPNITLVLQVCSPQSRKQYIHRAGRTARGDRAGNAVVVFTDRELEALRFDEFLDLGLQRIIDQGVLMHDERDVLANAVSSANWSENGVLAPLASATFASLLRHYSALGCFETDEIVDAAGELLFSCGVDELPPVSAKVAADLNLLSCQRLQLVADERDSGQTPRSSAPKPLLKTAPKRKQ